MNKKGRNLVNVKEENRSLVLRLICTGQCSSRMDISHKTGLTKMTITNIIQELINDSLVYEGEITNTNTVGRKPVSLFPSEKVCRSIGIYVSRDGAVISLLSLNAKILKSTRVDITIEDDANSLLEKVLNGINYILKGEKKRSILGIGIASIGPLDLENGRLLAPTDFFGIQDVPFKEFLEAKTLLPVFVNNDMNAAALAEQLYGYGVGVDDFLYLGLTHGVGAGIVANGKLYSGINGFGGEIGHLCIKYDGPICTCGNHGCLEVFASMSSFIDKVKSDAITNSYTLINSNLNITFHEIVEFARKGDAFCLKRLSDLIHTVSIALISTTNLLNYSKIFIGHESAQGGEWFSKKIEEQINRKILFKDSSKVEVLISKFKEHSPVVGSGILVFDQFFQGNIKHKKPHPSLLHSENINL